MHVHLDTRYISGTCISQLIKLANFPCYARTAEQLHVKLHHLRMCHSILAHFVKQCAFYVLCSYLPQTKINYLQSNLLPNRRHGYKGKQKYFSCRAPEGTCKARDKADQGGSRRTSNDALLGILDLIYWYIVHGKNGGTALAAATHKPIANTFSVCKHTEPSVEQTLKINLCK